MLRTLLEAAGLIAMCVIPYWAAIRWYRHERGPGMYVDPGDAGLVDEPPDDRIKVARPAHRPPQELRFKP